VRVECFYGGTIGPGVITGGDRHGLEVWSAWGHREGVNLHVNASALGIDLIERFGYPLTTRVTDTSTAIIGPSRLGYLRRCAAGVRAALQLRGVDVVYAASPYFYDLLPAVLAKMLNRSSRLLVALFHLIPPPWQRTGNRIVNTLAWIEQRLMIAVARAFADCIIVDNQDLVDDLVRLGFSRSRIVLSPMGVRDIGDAGPWSGAFDAVYVGRLSGPKGVPGLIEAWKTVVAALPRARLGLVGNNEVGFDTEALIAKHDLEERITVLSGLSDSEVRSVLGASRAFITGSLEEGYGLSVLEALAAGLPCVTFDLPAFRFAFPTGRVVADPFGDYGALGRVAAALLGDERRYKNLRAEIETSVRVKTWNAVADDLWAACL
jgi:glycosyltransferase involved in cell wall biosynthesis